MWQWESRKMKREQKNNQLAPQRLLWMFHLFKFPICLHLLSQKTCNSKYLCMHVRDQEEEEQDEGHRSLSPLQTAAITLSCSAAAATLVLMWFHQNCNQGGRDAKRCRRRRRRKKWCTRRRRGSLCETDYVMSAVLIPLERFQTRLQRINDSGCCV